MIETILVVSGLTGIAVLEGSTVGVFIAAAVFAAAFWSAALWRTLKGSQGARAFALKAAAYTLLVALLFVLNALNRRVGRQGAERIAAACEEYKTRKGAYPESLELLVPAYLKNIPPAKVSLRWSRYWLKDNQVLYVSEPGLVVAYYDLAAKERGHYGMYKFLNGK
jgi:hypothetical protein